MNSIIEALEDILIKLRDDSVYSNNEIIETIRELIDILQED
jgi:hypothetical protein